MKLRNLLLCLVILYWTPCLLANCKADSTKYPIYSLDTEGTKIVTITKSQQFFLTNNMLEGEKCKIVKEKQFQYIGILEEQIKDCDDIQTHRDTFSNARSLVIQKQESKLENMYRQLDAQKGISLSLQVERNNLIRRQKKKLLSWKVGTFTVIGIFAIALPTTIAILSK